MTSKPSLVFRLYSWIINALYLFPGRKLSTIVVAGSSDQLTLANTVSNILTAAGAKVSTLSSFHYQTQSQFVDNIDTKSNFHPSKLFHLLFLLRLQRTDWIVLALEESELPRLPKTGLPVHSLIYSAEKLNHNEKQIKTTLNLLKPEHLIYCADKDSLPLNLFKQTSPTSYGLDSKSNYRLTSANLGSNASAAQVQHNDHEASIEIAQTGKHGVYAALASFALASILEIKTSTTKAALKSSRVHPYARYQQNINKNSTLTISNAKSVDRVVSEMDDLSNNLTSNIVLVLNDETGDLSVDKRYWRYARQIFLVSLGAQKINKHDHRLNVQPSLEAAIKSASRDLVPNSCLLVTGQSSNDFIERCQIMVEWVEVSGD